MNKSFVIPSIVDVEKNFDNIKMVLYENSIMNIIFKENTLITVKDLTDVMKRVASLGERKYLNLMEWAYNTYIDSLVREFSASDKKINSR